MATASLDDQTALILVDVQKSIDDPYWAADGPRNNPDGERNISRLLEAWRSRAMPTVHVRHDSTDPESPFWPERATNAFKDEIAPRPGETVIAKATNSAFIGTDLENRLHDQGIEHLVIVGVITNNSLEATVRTAGNLGFWVRVAADACWTFAKRDYGGTVQPAHVVHDMALANMDGEYAEVLATETVLAALPQPD